MFSVEVQLRERTGGEIADRGLGSEVRFIVVDNALSQSGHVHLLAFLDLSNEVSLTGEHDAILFMFKGRIEHLAVFNDRDRADSHSFDSIVRERHADTRSGNVEIGKRERFHPLRNGQANFFSKQNIGFGEPVFGGNVRFGGLKQFLDPLSVDLAEQISNIGVLVRPAGVSGKQHFDGPRVASEGFNINAEVIDFGVHIVRHDEGTGLFHSKVVNVDAADLQVTGRAMSYESQLVDVVNKFVEIPEIQEKVRTCLDANIPSGVRKESGKKIKVPLDVGVAIADVNARPRGRYLAEFQPISKSPDSVYRIRPGSNREPVENGHWYRKNNTTFAFN